MRFARAIAASIQFALLRKICADSVDVRAGREPCAFDDGFVRGSCGDDDIGIVNGGFGGVYGSDGNFQ